MRSLSNIVECNVSWRTTSVFLLNASILNVPARMAYPPQIASWSTYVVPYSFRSTGGCLGPGDFRHWEIVWRVWHVWPRPIAIRCDVCECHRAGDRRAGDKQYVIYLQLGPLQGWYLDHLRGKTSPSLSTQCTVFSYTSLFVRNGALAPLYPNNYIEYFFSYASQEIQGGDPLRDCGLSAALRLEEPAGHGKMK